MRKRWLRIVAVPIAFTLVAAACGDDEEGANGTDAATDETTSAGTASEGTASEGTASEGTASEGTASEGTASEGTASEGTASESTGGGGNADLEGTEVNVFGVESSDEEAGAMQDALNVFAEENGMSITYVGARTFEEEINTQVGGGNPPDIATFPQPGKVADFAASGDVLEIPEAVLSSVSEGWDEDWLSFTNVDGTQYGVPLKSDLKSLVWYSPSAFAEKGYEIPETLDDFFTLNEEMIANGDVPLCVGIESGPATGWPFTDWTEEIILRNEGADYYNQWVTHEVPFNDPPVVEAMTAVADLWSTDGAVYAAGGSIAATPFGDNGQALVDGECLMHRQANFFSAFMPEGTEFGDGDGQINTFYFPSNEGEPILVGGLNAAAFEDRPEVWAVMEYLGSAEFADARQSAQVERKGGGEDVISGFLSANSNADQELYTDLEQGFLEVLNTGEPAAFDASDQMPGEVGAGSFLDEATSLVNGDTDAQAAADTVEESWPD